MPYLRNFQGIGIAGSIGQTSNANSGTIMGEVDINTLTMEQYLALTRGNQAPGMVKPEIGGNVNFEIKSQFMRELREDNFSGKKNDDAHEWVDRLFPGTVDSSDLLKKAFIQRYCPPSKTAKQLEEIRNFKQEGDETLYQAWERNVNSNNNSKGIAAIVSKLESLGRDMKNVTPPKWVAAE
ncbi:putative reverse transcriptase domain-containing protein [Tanacetum coccineum]